MAAQPRRFSREEFLAERFDYKRGEHVLLIGPTQRAGKTFLGWQALQSVMPYTAADFTAFCMKPRDRTVARWQRELGFRETPAWPPHRKLLEGRPPGHTLWPRHTFDPDVDDAHLRAELRKLMLDAYKHGNHVLWLDEIYGLLAELGLEKELLAILTRGGVMGCGAWMACQKPSGTQAAGIPGFVLNCPTHFLLANDNVKANRQRYGELAGNFDPREVEANTLALRRFEFLYLHANGYMCIVGAQ